MKIQEIADFINGKLNGAGEAEIERVAAFESATENEIAFLEKAESIAETNAACVIVPEDFAGSLACPTIRVENPKLAFAKIAARLHPFDWRTEENHKTAVIDSPPADILANFIGAFVTVGRNCFINYGTQIFAGTRIGSNVYIGKNSIIHPNCVIYDNVSIGHDCVIHAGAIIGADGFGYVRDGASGYVKFPQIGTVVIEDDVEIGANTCIDRGALGETRIGEGTKIDNLVQIAHNVQIGKRVVIASQTGISGSVTIEDDCVIGGQVGFGDHIRVRKGAIIGSKAGILPGKIVREGVWWGIPIQPLAEYKRQNAMVKGLPRLREEIKELKRQIEELKSK
ncbi:MAG TPA: UDP-3-O-(3-hydroxymyristoyl)glucosamine N-acyltransferase [Pyrinomonadaceae bacterium]|nr:UDP-3-O-(3-hydroxymyristoyl)glucosamine N-acyltransferase [Pyrinomonadaceae bacterium]